MPPCCEPIQAVLLCQDCSHTPPTADLCEEDVRLALSGLDGPLAALLSDAKSLKLLHGCNNDAVWLATNLGVAVSPPILDTQEAARCCSMPTTAVRDAIGRPEPPLALAVAAGL